MISVVHVITDLDVGGAETALLRLVSRLDRTEFETRVISLSQAGARADDLTKAGVPWTALGMKPGRLAVGPLWKLFRTIRRTNPDIVQTWLPHADLVGFLTGRLAGVRSICWNVRSAELARGDHPASLFVVLRALAYLSPRPTCVVANSVAGRQAYESMGYHPRRWELIPNGFDTDAYRPCPARRARSRAMLGIPDAACAVGIVGRFHPMKDHANFVEAAALVARDHPDTRWVLVGRGLAANTTLCGLIERLGLTSRCTVVDECRQTEEIFPAFDVTVSSSYSEAFPNVVAEAMACGVPCVVTDVGESATIVGDTGIVVRPRDPAALAGGILGLLEVSHARRLELGRAARERVVSRFSLQSMVTRYEDLYRELAQGRASAGTAATTCAE